MEPLDKPGSNMSQIQGAAASVANSNPPSNNLWIGNVSLAVSETELKLLLEKYGKIDSLTLYPSRNYAFVYFREVDSATAAKHGLQGYVLRGNALKIEFAKSAKPCKSLWVAGISQSISKEELEKEFLRFGKLQEFRFLRDRNTAYVDYTTLDDAANALKSMNGKRIGGTQLRVDFLRSQSSKREQGSDVQFPMGRSDFHWMAQDPLKVYSEPSPVGLKRPNFSSMGPQNGNSHPTNILRVSYPHAAIIEEDMLHNAMILFGEIERLKTFADRKYALVEFRSVEEARRAKEGLQGKLFKDPRISIEYSGGELGLENDYIPHYPGAERHLPFRPVRMDIPGLNNPVIPIVNPGHPSPMESHGPDGYMRPLLGPQGPFDRALPGPEFSDSAPILKPQNLASQSLVGGISWGKSSPRSGVISSPSAGLNLRNRSASAGWDVFDDSQHRESKRQRSDAALPFARMENKVAFDEKYGPSSLSGRAPGSLTRVSTSGAGQRHTESDCVWRGIIAKGGTLVCHARCVSMGDGFDADIPEVVNCSARTGLDLLSKHYDEAIGFNIVFFLPDSEEDFAPYTEFLRYLGSKDRAGVAKFDDGTTLFLVPPSDFLTKVLKVSGPERLYGVVLKFPQLVPGSGSVNPQLIQPHYVNSHKPTSLQPGYSVMPQLERASPVGYSGVLPEGSKFPAKPSGSMTSGSFTSHTVPPTAVASQASLALTPELIATLTSLLPTNSSSNSQVASLPQTTSIQGPASKVTTGPNMDHMQWKQEHYGVDHNVQSVQQLGSQIHTQMQHVTQAHTPQSVSESHFHQPFNSYSQTNESSISFPSQGVMLSKSTAPTIPLTATREINQRYQQGSSQDILRGQGIDYGTDASRFYGSSVVQQPVYSMALSNQIHGGNVTQTYTPEASNIDPTLQDQHLHTAPHGAVQESIETEADKNERYKTTLLFAANLLSRIHQPSGSQPGQGAGTN